MPASVSSAPLTEQEWHEYEAQMDGPLYEKWLLDMFQAFTDANPDEPSLDVPGLIYSVACGYHSGMFSDDELRPQLIKVEEALRRRMRETTSMIRSGTLSASKLRVFTSAFHGDERLHAEIKEALLRPDETPMTLLRRHHALTMKYDFRHDHLWGFAEDGQLSFAREILKRGFPEMWDGWVTSDTGSLAHDHTVQRIVEAERLLGRGRTSYFRITDILTKPKEAEMHAFLIRAGSLSGDAGEIALAESSELEVRTLPRCASAEDARTQVHGLLRNPAMFEQELVGSDRISVRVDVTPVAFQELVAEGQRSPTWRGVHLASHGIHVSHGDSASPENTDMTQWLLPPADGDTPIVCLSACARHAVRIGQREISVNYALVVGAHTTSRAGRTAAVATRYAELTAAVEKLIPGVSVEELDVSIEAISTSLREMDGRNDASVARLPSRDEFLGPERCSHPNATWAPTKDGFEALRCPRCTRQRIATRPTMELLASPNGVNTVNAHRLLAGEERFATLDEAQAWREEIPDDPGVYATGAGSPASQRMKRPLTFRDALNRH